MNIEDFRDYCLSKDFVTESFPFNETALVFKVGTKMFALTDIETFQSVNLKCDPEKAIDFNTLACRDQDQWTIPGSERPI